MRESTDFHRAEFQALRIQGLEEISRNTRDFQRSTLLLEAEAREQVRHDKLQAEHVIAGLRAAQQTLAQSCRSEVAALENLSRE